MLTRLGVLSAFFFITVSISMEGYAAEPESCLRYRHAVVEGGEGLSVVAIEDRVDDLLLCIANYRLERERLLDKITLLKERLETDVPAADEEENDGNTETGVEKEIAELKNQLHRVQDKLSVYEEDLRVIGKRLNKVIEGERFCTPRRLSYEHGIIAIENYFELPSYARLYISHGDYDRYFFKVNVGYEYTSISGILETTSPRLGLLIYTFYGDRPFKEKYGHGYYGVQLAGNLILSGTTEQKAETSGEADPDEIDRTLGIDVSLFAPYTRSKVRPDLALETGPVLTVGANANDQERKIRERVYFGIRSAMSPEHFIDFIIGRSPGLESRRLEVRGQMPVAKLGRESRIFLGAVANMGIINEQPNEDDVITVYLSWNIDFLDLFAPGS